MKAEIKVTKAIRTETGMVHGLETFGFTTESKFKKDFEIIDKIKYSLIHEDVEKAEHTGQVKLLRRICQDMFDACALNIPMDYIYKLKKEIDPNPDLINKEK